ncbi:MAG: beta-lactamase family protein [Muribaculaceae bacterium]|nr:beta-lactamase family protein [Muribaculaceae bacterium]
MRPPHFLLIFFFVAFASCTTFKSIKCGSPSTDTYRNFALDTIASNSAAKNVLISSANHDRYFEDSKFTGGRFNSETIGEYFARVRGNGALLIVRNDTILLEKYYGSFSQLSPSNIFSITKAITALLCGIAIDEGYISLTDPVTKYITELNNADPMFKELTIEHLLDMRTGIDFQESYGWNPFSKMAKLYYGKDVVKQFKKLHFTSKPGTAHYYNSMATALLGVAIERAVGTPYARYLQEKVWKPLDMEVDAFISLDDNKNRQAKAYGGLVSNVRDLAKIGRLYINGGVYGNKRIVSKEWIDRSTHSSLENEAYSLGWNNIITRIDGKDVVTPRFFAIGLFGQVLFCDPTQNLIFVTLGEKKGCEYHLLFDDFCNLISN